MKFRELKDLCVNIILGIEIVRYFTIGFEDAAVGDREKTGEFNGFCDSGEIRFGNDN